MRNDTCDKVNIAPFIFSVCGCERVNPNLSGVAYAEILPPEFLSFDRGLSDSYWQDGQFSHTENSPQLRLDTHQIVTFHMFYR